MRYRHLSYRYQRIVRSGPSWVVWSDDRLRLLAQTRWQPDADMCETAGAIEVMVDLAGVEEDDFEVQLFEDVLVVEGRRHLPACAEGGVYHGAAIRQGPFLIALPLPAAVDAERVQARYERGLLRITLPKRMESR
ncbi:MAG: Hsp20/alpha crystallin family protein [Candidatus Rokubacteria bacterium]|nr:Hsp20/alpha crystallin family protein [Candidatus Rokubacteria bacterium]